MNSYPKKGGKVLVYKNPGDGQKAPLSEWGGGIQSMASLPQSDFPICWLLVFRISLISKVRCLIADFFD